jgi:hypothetical protein
MIANDPYLQKFVNKFTGSNQGKAFLYGIKRFRRNDFEDYETNRKKNKIGKFYRVRSGSPLYLLFRYRCTKGCRFHPNAPSKVPIKNNIQFQNRSQ